MPYTPEQPSLMRMIKEIKDRLRRLETRQSLPFSTISKGGLTIKDAGSLTMQGGGDINVNGGKIVLYDSDGSVVGELGTLSTGPDDQGLRLVRTDPGVEGKEALSFRGGFIGFRDATGNPVVADDITSRLGLARPHIGGGMVWANTNVATWPATTNAAFTVIGQGLYEVHNPRIRFSAQVQADASTTGQFRMMIDGTQVGATKSVTGVIDWWQEFQLALPAGTGLYSQVTVTIQASRTAGTGTIRCALMQFGGDQSP